METQRMVPVVVVMPVIANEINSTVVMPTYRMSANTTRPLITLPLVTDIIGLVETESWLFTTSPRTMKLDAA